MSGDDRPADDGESGDERAGADEEVPVETPADASRESTDRLSAGKHRAVAEFDEGVVDLLSWVLDTETRARIYVFLRQEPWSTSEEVAEGTGLYPSTVREALAELDEEETVRRRKRASEGAGNNPYEYTAIAPSELVGSVVDQVQDELNAVFRLDRYLGSAAGDEDEFTEPDGEPVTITVEEEPIEGDAGDEDTNGSDGDDAGVSNDSTPDDRA